MLRKTGAVADSRVVAWSIRHDHKICALIA
jgi:hypothetical protein